MSWDRFKRVLIRLNAAMVLIGWAAFFGYGFAENELPPLDVYAIVLLMTICAVVALSAASFVLCHTWLFLRAKAHGQLPRFDHLERRGFGLLISGAVILSTLVVVANSSQGAVPGSVEVIVGILGVLALVYGGISSAMALGGQYFNWFFTQNDYVSRGEEGVSPTT